MNYEIIGYIAAIFTSLYLLPQIMKIYKTRSVRDISTTSILVLFLGAFLWVLYGFFKHSFPVMIGNTILVLFCCVILYYKSYKYLKSFKSSNS